MYKIKVLRISNAGAGVAPCINRALNVKGSALSLKFPFRLQIIRSLNFN